MIVETVLAVLVVIVLKAFIESDWFKGEKKTYSKPGVLRFPKHVIVQLHYLVMRVLRALSSGHLAAIPPGSSFMDDVGTLNCRETDLSKTQTRLCFNGFSSDENNENADAGIILKLFYHADGRADIYLYLRVPGNGFLQLPNHPEPLTCLSTSKHGQYRAGDLILEVIEPKKKWKIAYHGEMRMVDTLADPQHWHKGKNLVFVKFNFTWTAYSSVFDCAQHTHANLVSETLSREPWSWNFHRKLKRFRTNHHYDEQWGQLRGRVYVDGMAEGEDGMRLSLRGAKEHFKGSLDSCHRYMKINAHTSDGLSLGLVMASFADFITHFVSGYLILPNHHLVPICRSDLRLWRHGEEGVVPNIIQFNIEAGSSNYNVVCMLSLKPVSYYSYGRHTRMHDAFADVYVDSIPGKGVVELYYGKPTAPSEVTCGVGIPLKVKQPHIKTDSKKWTLLLSESDCANPLLVGTKAADISRLFSTRDESLSVEFQIPDGFCITMHAYNEFLKENKCLQAALDELKAVLKNGSKEDISAKSKTCLAAFADATLPTKLIADIKENIQLIKNNFKSGLVVIVRCSHIKLSAEENCFFPSFGNITSINQVLNAVLRCWASQFSYEVLLNRRQAGFPIDLGMGVIVQVMHDEERVSGTLSSCQPKTGDPSEIVVIPDYSKYSTSSGYFLLNKLEEDMYDVSKILDQHESFQKQNRRTSETKVFVVDEGHKLLLSHDDLFRLAKISQFVKKSFHQEVFLKWTISARGRVRRLY